MGRYFGTDGIRGKANETLLVETAYQVGVYLGAQAAKQGRKILIGRDTRLSSPMFEHAVATGAAAAGAHADILGVCATPALSYTTKALSYDYGVMISASHNPYYDNGIKCFGSDGLKLADEIEADIETFIDGKMNIPLATDAQIGTIHTRPELLDVYLQHLTSLVQVPLTGLKIVLDLANGAATASARQIFAASGCTLTVINETPDGVNINTACGSTHPQKLQETVRTLHADMGFAYDGDADRCIAVDQQGDLVDGDKILYACGLDLKQQGKLRNNTVVATVMSNLGLLRALEQQDIQLAQTGVGDKQVFEEMVRHDDVIGGEQSGHIIFRDLAPTGDGVTTSLLLAQLVVRHKRSLRELTQAMVTYPQKLINVRVRDKQSALSDPTIQQAIQQAESQLGDDGRILIRPSGTEPLIRVMVEASDQQQCDTLCLSLAQLFEQA